MALVLPLYDENRSLKRPYINYCLITINAFVFFFFFLQGPEGLNYEFITFGVIPGEILRGERLWTLLTSMFIHADVMHLLGNMVFLWVFGDNIEDSIGHLKYLIFYLVAGFIASFAHIASTIISQYTSLVPYFSPNLDVPSIGASGAISAVLGAYLLLYPRSKIRTVVYIIYIITFASVPAYYYLGFWFLYQLLMGFGGLLGASSSVAFWAHVGGFIFGMVIMKVLDVKPKGKQVLLSKEERVGPVQTPWTISPLVDVIIEDDRVTIMANIPGVENRDIEIKVTESTVDISAEYTDIKFNKQVTLPVRIIPKVENRIYRNGMLSFTLHRVL